MADDLGNFLRSYERYLKGEISYDEIAALVPSSTRGLLPAPVTKAKELGVTPLTHGSGSIAASFSVAAALWLWSEHAAAGGVALGYGLIVAIMAFAAGVFTDKWMSR